jgi:hypothetical protein
MNIREYLNRNNIDWFPINIKIVKGSKVPSRIADYEDGHPWVDSWRPGASEIEHMKTYLDQCNAIVVDTTNVHHLDMDLPTVYTQIVRNSEPWYPSFTKKLPHAFYTGNRQPVPGSEILIGRWAFAPKDALVHNFNIKIPAYK